MIIISTNLLLVTLYFLYNTKWNIVFIYREILLLYFNTFYGKITSKGDLFVKYIFFFISDIIYDDRM